MWSRFDNIGEISYRCPFKVDFQVMSQEGEGSVQAVRLYRRANFMFSRFFVDRFSRVACTNFNGGEA